MARSTTEHSAVMTPDAVTATCNLCPGLGRPNNCHPSRMGCVIILRVLMGDRPREAEDGSRGSCHRRVDGAA